MRPFTDFFFKAQLIELLIQKHLLSASAVTGGLH